MGLVAGVQRRGPHDAPARLQGRVVAVPRPSRSLATLQAIHAKRFTKSRYEDHHHEHKIRNRLFGSFLARKFLSGE